MRHSPLPITANRVVWRGREYDLTWRPDVNDLAFLLGIHREVAGLYASSAGQDAITAAIWRTLLIGAYAVSTR